MKYRFQKHYTRDEAESLLPQLRAWLAELNRLREEVELYDKRLGGLNSEGQDTGGETVNKWIRALAGMQQILAEFQRREIFIKDLSRGLIDFPALIGGKEVFLSAGNPTRTKLNSGTISKLATAVASGWVELFLHAAGVLCIRAP